jgi:PEP-CTERM motif
MQAVCRSVFGRLGSGRSVLAAIVLVAALTSPAFAIAPPDAIFFSTSSSVPGTPGDINVTYNTLASQTLYVWITSTLADEITPPITGYTDVTINGVVNHVPFSFSSISLKYQEHDGNNVSLSGATVFNSPISNITELDSSHPLRWDSLGTNGIASTLISNQFASTTSIRTVGQDFTNPVLSNQTDHFGLSSANTDNVGGAWLFGSLTFDTTALGTSAVSIQAGPNGIFTSDDITSHYNFYSANINVVPEPASAVLAGIGLLALSVTMRRRRK